MITIYTFNPKQDNIFVSELFLESKNELINYPINIYTEIKPPEYLDNKTLHFINNKWVYKDIIEVTESYRDKRKRAYPNLTTQLDMLWHDINNDKLNREESTFFNTIKSIKEEYPKDIIEYPMD